MCKEAIVTERKLLLRCLSGGPRKATKSLGQNSECCGQDSSPEPLEYKSYGANSLDHLSNQLFNRGVNICPFIRQLLLLEDSFEKRKENSIFHFVSDIYTYSKYVPPKSGSFETRSVFWELVMLSYILLEAWTYTSSKDNSSSSQYFSGSKISPPMPSALLYKTFIITVV
jgi:hypothetical protein